MYTCHTRWPHHILCDPPTLCTTLWLVDIRFKAVEFHLKSYFLKFSQLMSRKSPSCTELRVRHTRQHIQKIRARWHHPNALHARAHRNDEMRRWSCPAAYACAAAQQSPGSCDVDRPVPASRDAGQLGLQGLQLRADALGVLGAVLAALPVLRTSLGQAGGPRLGLGRRLRSPLLLRLKLGLLRLRPVGSVEASFSATS